MEQKRHENMENIFLNTPQIKELKTINNIRFTAREIDIIACIVGGRTYKDISSLLSISPKTVAIHVRNIMLRLGSNSQENIIDFIEESGKFSLIKKHYSTLLIKANFEIELKKTTELTKPNNINCLIFYYKKQKGKDLFAYELGKHLNIAGINTSIREWEKGKAEKFLVNKLASQSINYIIYAISDEFLEYLQQKEKYEIIKEAYKLITAIKQTSNHVIFLKLNYKEVLTSEQKIDNFTCIDVKEQKNYYFLVFAIIKKLLPYNEIEQNINSFQTQQAIFLKHSQFQIWLRENDIYNNILFIKNLFINYYKRYKKLFIATAINLLLIIFIGFMLFEPSKRPQFLTANANTKNVQSAQTDNNYGENEGKAKQNLFTSQLANIISYGNTLQKIALLNLPPRNIRFTGREMALTQIEKQFSNCKFGIIAQTISGLGGVGKTQLATEFAYQAIEKKTYDAIFWVAADTEVMLANSYKEFAKQLQIDVKGLKASAIQTLLHQELATTYSNKKILFILDNVFNYDNIQDYLSKLYKQCPTNYPLHILITTRSQYWPETPLILEVFAVKEAMAFIKKHLPNEENIAIEQLAKMLNYFPLALSQAVAYIKKHTNIDDYLKLYKKQKYQFLDKISGEDTQYKVSLWKTWNISLSKLSNNARYILFVSAYLSADDVPIGFFADLSTEDRAQAIRELRSRSFIILKNHNKSFKVHKLLQEVIRLSINTVNNNYNKSFAKNNIPKNSDANYIWLNKAMSLLENKFDFDYMQCEKWNLWSYNISHARSIAEHTFMLKGEIFERGLKLYCKVAMFMTYINWLPDAFDMWLKVRDLIEQQNKKSNALILARINYHLGAVLMHNKNPVAAIDYFRKAMLITKDEHSQVSAENWDFLSILGIKAFYNKETMVNYKNICLANNLISLGNAQRDLGNFVQSITNYNKAIVFLKSCPNNKLTKYYNTTLLDQLGYTYVRAGNLMQAEHILHSIRKEIDHKYSNHVEQANLYIHLVKLYYLVGELDKSKELLRTILSFQKGVYNKQHLRMGHVTFEKIRIDLVNNNIHSAKTKLNEVEQMYKLYYNDNFCNYAFIYLYFSRVYESLGKYDEALNYLTKSLAIAKAYFQENLHMAMAFQITQAEKWPQLAKVTNVNYWSKALTITIKLFGANHYQVARYYYLLGQALESKGDIQKAQLQYKTALKIINKQSINHPNLIKFHNEHTQLIQKRLSKACKEKKS